MPTTNAERAHVLRRINEAATVADLQAFWQDRIGIPLKEKPEYKLAYYARFKRLTKKRS